jgi:hypothetical protein
MSMKFALPQTSQDEFSAEIAELSGDVVTTADNFFSHKQTRFRAC